MPGGGYTTVEPAHIMGTDLVKASGSNIIVIDISWRVGPYGFLSSRAVADDPSASLNNGIKDIIMALQWTRDHVSSFGGDPGHVTVGGVSAGAGALAVLQTAYGGQNKTMNSLYHALAGNEPFSPPFFTPDQFQTVYDNLTAALNCTGSNSMSCLRSAPIAALQKANVPFPLPGANSTAMFTWSPSIDGLLIPDTTASLLRAGRGHAVPALWGDDANGGSTFIRIANYSTPTLGAAAAFLRNTWPQLTATQAANGLALYNSSNVPQLTTNQTTPNLGAYYDELIVAYDDIAVRCPSLALGALSHPASLALGGGNSSNGTSMSKGRNAPKTWSFIYNVTNPLFPPKLALGATHGEEVSAVFGPQSLMPADATPLSQLQVTQLQAYWTSFIRFYDPNVGRGNSSGPMWSPYVGGQAGGVGDPKESETALQMWFQNDTTTTAMQGISELQRARCAYWDLQAPSMLL